MVSRLGGKELIEQSLTELLGKKSIEDITVREIAQNCGISSRAFYNHFHDKHEAASAVYTRYMTPHLNAALDKWYSVMGSFFACYSVFMDNTLCYSGQNCLSDTILELEWKKLRRHVRPEIISDDKELVRTEIAIEYMLHGNVGSLRSTYLHKSHSLLWNYPINVYNGTWEYMCGNIPPLILKNLSMEIVDPFSPEELEM